MADRGAPSRSEQKRNMQRALLIGGRNIILEALGQPLDGAFDRLHAAHFGNAALPWDEFEAAAHQFFTNNPNDADRYFNNFTVVWRSILETGNYAQAEYLWQQALQPALSWEQAAPNRRLHKGTPYYFWAMTALLRGDIDHGYLLIHQAVDEDIRSTGAPRPDTPGYALVSLNYQRVDQAFRHWVIEQARFLAALLDNYTAIHGRALSIDDAKQRFIDQPPSIETVFLFTYTLARLRKLAELPPHATSNSFAGQLEVNLLFDLTLVIDSAIKARNQQRYFIDHAATLLNAAGAVLTNAQLRDINTQLNTNFDTALQAGLDATMTVPPQNTPLNRLQCDVALAYGIRNHGAHSTGAAPTIWNRFPEVQQALFRTLAATIDHLY
jgi:hypothetical protein